MKQNNSTELFLAILPILYIYSKNGRLDPLDLIRICSRIFRISIDDSGGTRSLRPPPSKLLKMAILGLREALASSNFTQNL